MKHIAAILFTLSVLSWGAMTNPVRADEPVIPENEVIEFLRDNAPEILTELQALRAEAPEEYRDQVQDLAEQIAEYYRVKEESPELAESLLKAERLEYKSWKLGERIANAKDEDEQQALTTQLRDLLNEIFDARLFQQEQDLQDMEREVADIRGMVEKRKQHREEIIERHLRDIIADSDETLSW